MPYEEATKWTQGQKQTTYYQRKLQAATEQKQREETLKKVVKSQDMPWENSPQGRIKHIMNEELDARFYSLDCYIQELPPGGRSGKHRHFAEECLYILEGRGYDLHWDASVEIRERYHWSWASEPKRFEWEEGDCVYIPPNTVHQHCNADPSKPARFISATNRTYKHLGYGDIEQLENAPEYKPQP